MCVAVALLDMKQSRKIHMDTEVWSWGCGDRGQLGHADLLDRWLSVVFFKFLILVKLTDRVL